MAGRSDAMRHYNGPITFDRQALNQKSLSIRTAAALFTVQHSSSDVPATAVPNSENYRSPAIFWPFILPTRRKGRELLRGKTDFGIGIQHALHAMMRAVTRRWGERECELGGPTFAWAS